MPPLDNVFWQGLSGPHRAWSAGSATLAAPTRPGPFGPRTLEMGDYFGVFEGERLIAMAGDSSRRARPRPWKGILARDG